MKVRSILASPLVLLLTEILFPVYKRRIAKRIASYCKSGQTLLDVGCDDGRVAELIGSIIRVKVMGIDINPDRPARIPKRIYNGKSIPYPINSFDVVIAVDVLHHTTDIGSLLKEMARVARKKVIIKDLVKRGKASWLLLALWDYMTNAPLGIQCSFNYPSAAQWKQHFDEAGLRLSGTAGRINMCFGVVDDPVFVLEKIGNQK